MMLFTHKVRVYACAGLFISAVLCAAFFISAKDGRFLEIRDTGTGMLYGSYELEGGNGFSLEFIHSVNQSPVRETYVQEEGRIRPYSVRFSSFGAGMTSDLEEGLRLTRDEDAMIITGFKKSYKEISFIVGTVSDHLLYLSGPAISLRELCGKNAHITFRLK